MTRPTPEEVEGIRSLAGPDLECECCDNASADKLKLLAEIDALRAELVEASRLHRWGELPGKRTKVATHRRERRIRDKAVIREEVEGG